MNRIPRNEILEMTAELSGTRAETLRAQDTSVAERRNAIDTAAANPDFPNGLKQEGVESRQELSEAVENSVQKSWFNEYVYNQDSPVLGTAWNLLTAKPVEGVVNAATFNKIPLVGKLARAAAVAAGVYFGVGLLGNGAELAYQAGNTLLDRMGAVGGYLFPTMNMPSAPYRLQPLPSVNPWASA